MAKRQKKYVTHNSLSLKLYREGFRGTEHLATTLLNMHFELGGILGSRQYYASSLETPGQSYTVWIERLIDNGWLVRKADISTKQDYIKYQPGVKLMPYINKEKSAKEEIASVRELHNMKNQIMESVDSRLTRIEETLGNMYSAIGLGKIDPPDFPKLKQHLRLVK